MSAQLTRTDLRPEALAHLSHYLDQVRAYLAGCHRLDSDEVVQDILDHVDREFEGVTESVDQSALAAVLERLGSPLQWVNAEDLPWWRRVWTCLPQSDRGSALAYLSLWCLCIRHTARSRRARPAGCTAGSLHTGPRGSGCRQHP